MNRKEHLLTEALTDGAGEAFARAAAAHARRRRTGKQLAGGTAVLAAIAAAWYGMTRPLPITSPDVTKAPPYEIISDAELLAQLQDQPVLLLKDQDRITGVVFLRPVEGKL